MFVYTTKKAYPDTDIKIFLRGELDKKLKPLVDNEVIENSFLSYPKSTYLNNALRHIISPKLLKDYDIVWITDIDFLIFKQKPSHFEYYYKIMKKNNLPYASFRSAISKPYRPNISPSGWRNEYTRIVSGTAAFIPKLWYAKTKEIIKQYKHNIKKNLHDNFDTHKPGSYREYDEVLFYRICKLAGLPIPTKRWEFPDGTKFKNKYRDIHLGDFKFKKRVKRKLKKLICNKNLKQYVNLYKDEKWQEIIKACSKNKTIRDVRRRLDTYTMKTLNLKSLLEAETAKTTLENVSEASINKQPIGKP